MALNPQYVPKSLTKADRRRQLRSIRDGTRRPKVESFKSKRSPHVVRFEKRFGTKITDDKFIGRSILAPAGIQAVLRKGRGAYFSSGSRPNQTPDSWARARLASVILGGNARQADRQIWDRYRRSYRTRLVRLKTGRHKFRMDFVDRTGKVFKATKFGARGYSDYTKHKDPQRKQRYIRRHDTGRQDHLNPFTAGALSRWILWNKRSISASYSDFNRRFMFRRAPRR